MWSHHSLPPVLGGAEPIAVTSLGAVASHVYSAGTTDGLAPWAVFAAFALAVILLESFGLARGIRLLRPSTLRPSPATSPRRGLPGRLRRSASARWLLDGRPRRIPLLSDPVFQEELRTRFWAGSTFRRRLLWGSFLFLLVLGPHLPLDAFHYNGVGRFGGPACYLSWTAIFCMLCSVPVIVSWPVTRAGPGDGRRGAGASSPRTCAARLLAHLYALGGLLGAAILGIAVLLGQDWLRTALASPAASAGGASTMDGMALRGFPSKELTEALVLSAVLVTTYVSMTAILTAVCAFFRRWVTALSAAIGLAALLYCVLPGWIGAACRSGRMPSREIWCAASPWRAAYCVVEPECSPGDAVPFFVAAWGAALIAALLPLVVSVVRRGVAEVCRTTAQSARQRESPDRPWPERP